MRSLKNFGLTSTLKATASPFTSLCLMKKHKYATRICESEIKVKVQLLHNPQTMHICHIYNMVSFLCRRASGKQYVSTRMKSKATRLQVIKTGSSFPYLNPTHVLHIMKNT